MKFPECEALSCYPTTQGCQIKVLLCGRPVTGTVKKPFFFLFFFFNVDLDKEVVMMCQFESEPLGCMEPLTVTVFSF